MSGMGYLLTLLPHGFGLGSGLLPAMALHVIRHFHALRVKTLHTLPTDALPGILRRLSLFTRKPAFRTITGSAAVALDPPYS